LEKTESNLIEAAKVQILAEIVEYVPNSVVIKTIVNKTTGTIKAFSFDAGEGLNRKISPFDNFIQIIDGNAEIIINGISSFLIKGQSIIIPAHTSSIVKANERFKMISTIIKCGYE
jgi:quercetin dioxygenase-like cupin family protein